jgi:hypothetical protein
MSEPTSSKRTKPESTDGAEATAVVERYFECMRAGNLAVVDLFAEDAILLGLGRRTEGRDAIRAFYTESIASGGPQPRSAGPLLSDGKRVAAEIYIDLANGPTMHVVDLFRIEEGRIRSLHYFVADEPADETATGAKGSGA